MEWTVTRDGEYRASFVPDEPGAYAINVEAARVERRPEDARHRQHSRAGVGRRRGVSFDASMRASLLKRIAEETGGRFFTPSNAATLPEAVSYTGRGVTVVEERDLWDMPILLLLMLGLMGTSGPTAACGVSRDRSAGGVAVRSASRLRRLAGRTHCSCSLLSMASIRSRHPPPRHHGRRRRRTSTRTQFHQWATAIVDAAKERGGLTDDTITYLGDKPDLAPGAHQGPIDAATTCRRRSPTSRPARRPTDEVFIVLIGHGSFDGKVGGVQSRRARPHRRGLRRRCSRRCWRSGSSS